jgi:hypothetical protein
MQYTLTQISGGELGTDQTVKKIAELVRGSLRKPDIRNLALSIIGNRAPENRVRALFDFVKENIRYVHDPIELELVQSPEMTLRTRAGDCDDHTALLSALALSVGVPARFRVIGGSRDSFQHIYPELRVNGNWLPADTTGKVRFGARVAEAPVEKIYDYRGDQFMSLGASLDVGLPVRRETVQRAAYNAAMAVLNRNWAQGRINLSDVKSYIRVIKEGNSPSRGTIVETPMLKAIQDFEAAVTSTGARSSKLPGSLNGLEGLDGFLSSIWDGVKKAVGVVVGGVSSIIGGGGSGKPAAENTIPPDSARSAVSEFLSSPVVLVGLGLLGYMAFVKKR